MKNLHVKFNQKLQKKKGCSHFYVDHETFELYQEDLQKVAGSCPGGYIDQKTLQYIIDTESVSTIVRFKEHDGIRFKVNPLSFELNKEILIEAKNNKDMDTSKLQCWDSQKIAWEYGKLH
jgi:hypothetical protein